MASVSREYMINDCERNNDKKKAGSVTYNALILSMGLDLTALLIATKKGIDRLPMIYHSEAKA